MLRRLARLLLRALRDERGRDALRDRIALTEAIVRQIPNAIFTKDAEGRFTMMNRAWSEMSGVSAERAVGKTVHDIYPPEIARRFAEEDARLIAQGAAAEPTEAEHSGPRPGQWRIVKKAVLSRDDGTVMGLVATSTDISELKRIQAELADRAKLETDLVDALPISVALRDTECRFVQVNRTWERYFGIAREDAIGRRFSELPGWQDNPELVKVAREAESIDRELMARGPQAPPLLFEDARLGRSYLLGRQIFTDSAGRVTGLIATGVDTSELRAAQRALALERERLALLVRSTRAGFSEWDADTDVVTFSERFKEMLGYAADVDTSAWRIFELMHPDDGARVFEKFRAMIQPRADAAAHQPAEAMEYRLRRADGGYLWVRAEGLVQRDDAGRARRFITSYIDISALREQEQSLRDQMVLTSALFDDNPNAMYVKDPQGRYVTVNDAWLKMVGLTRERAIGRTVLELFPEKESERYHVEDMRLIAQGEGSSEMESLRTGPDGTPQWVIIRKRVLRRADGTLVGLIGTNTDITELKLAQLELADRAKFVAELVDAMPISVAMRDAEGRYMLVNRAWERYFGVQRELALGRRRRELPGWPSDPKKLADAEEIERLDREMLERGPDYTPEPQETLRLGRYYLMTRRALSDSSGKPIGVVSAGIDMTERRAMEAELAAERQRLALVVSAAQVGIIDWDTATEAPWYSERFKEMLGYPADADTSTWGTMFGTLVHPDERDRTREVFLTGLMSAGAPNSASLQEPLELRLRRADGAWLWVESHGITLRDEAGEANRYLAAIMDISQRRVHEQQLRESVRLREEVERMSRHDLKTPLNSVIAVSRLLREGAKLSSEDEELLSIVERAGYRILNMVNLSLDLFRMEQASYQFRPQAVDLADVADKVAADLYSQAESKGVGVRVKRQGSANTPDGAVLARAEELLCYSMLANVVKNAIEAAPPKTAVTITFDRAPDIVRVHVHNAGAVPQALRERFFEKYSTSGKSGGLGIGTYSARLMARVQGGEAIMRTSDAEGTTISIALGASTEPFVARSATPAQAAAAAKALPPLPELSVLVVDDDEFNRLVVRRYLPSPPLKLAMAVNGLAALEAARRDWPDVILLDLEMPVMDGYECARRLREMERAENRKRASIIAFSSNDEQKIIERALGAGCDQYVVKPVPRHVLWQLLTGSGSQVVEATAAAEAKASDIVHVDEDLRSAIPEFLASRRRLLDNMPAALAAGDRARFKRLAHRIAGSCALYGFAWAAAQADALEDAAASGEPKELLARAAALRAHFDSVKIDYAAAKSAAK